MSVCTWYCTTLSFGTGQWFELQSMYSQLQILSASIWYCTTPSVATEQRFQIAINQYFRLILNYPFSCCNQTVFRVAIDLHSDLQIMSCSAWYCTTPSVATRQWFELQLMYTLSCNYWVLPLDTVLRDMGPHRTGSHPSPTGGSGQTKDTLTYQWALANLTRGPRDEKIAWHASQGSPDRLS
jgi:hypothetical protein